MISNTIWNVWMRDGDVWNEETSLSRKNRCGYNKS